MKALKGNKGYIIDEKQKKIVKLDKQIQKFIDKTKAVKQTRQD